MARFSILVYSILPAALRKILLMVMEQSTYMPDCKFVKLFT